MERTRARPEDAALAQLPALMFLLHQSGDLPTPAPLLIAVHGIARAYQKQIDTFAAGADERGHLLAAPNYCDGPWSDYQRLGRGGLGLRADLALLGMISELRERGAASEQTFLFGYSGGGQFVHRFAMAHPESVSAAVIASAGWYTFPDAEQAYPYGLQMGDDMSGLRMRSEAFLKVPMLAIVGDEDLQAGDDSKSSSGLLQGQGTSRRERAERWVAAMQAAAREHQLPERVELEVFRGAGHSFEDCVREGLVERVFAFLDRACQPLPAERGA